MNNSNTRRVWLSFSLLLVLAFTFSCAGDETQPEPRGKKPSLYGSVFLDSVPASGGVLVRIVQTRDSVYTNAKGQYSFFSLPSDTYTVVASSAGYAPEFAVVDLSSAVSYRVADLNLQALHCYPLDSLPEGYPLGVRFTQSTAFFQDATSYTIGDSMFVVGFEYYLPPLKYSIRLVADDYFDLIVISSLGDMEKVPIYEVLGSIPEIARVGYIVRSRGSAIPTRSNGIVEIEPSGGWVTAMYHSHWLGRYVCRSIALVPREGL